MFLSVPIRGIRGLFECVVASPAVAASPEILAGEF
jgi:hypothetical protein